MSSLHVTVGEVYQHVVGVDTHAASHAYAIVAAATGKLIDQRQFPTSPAGLARARDWIGRRTGGDLDGVLISAEGTGSYGALMSEGLAAIGYRVVEAPTPRRGSDRRKTDELDALLAARTTAAMPVDALRDRRSGEARAALQVLATARDRLTQERTAKRNALNALARTHDLGIDARRALTDAQVRLIASWRGRNESMELQIARAEAVRLADGIQRLDAALKGNQQQTRDLVRIVAPELLEVTGIREVTAAVILAAWSHPGRVRSESAFAMLAGVAPIPASSGKTTRHRLNRGGDRRLNRALHMIALTRLSCDAETQEYVQRRRGEGKSDREIRRCLKRFIARQIYRLLNQHHTAPATT